MLMPGIRWRLFTCFLSSFLTSFLSLLFFVVSSFFAQFVLWFFPSWAVLGKHALFCSLSLFLSLPLSRFSTLRFLCLGLARDFRAFPWLRFSCLGLWRCLCHALWLDVTLRCARRNWRMCIFAQLIWSVVSVAVVVESRVSSSFHRYFGLLAL